MPRAMFGVVFALVAWATWFIYRTTFDVGGVRYFSLFDDAMISMVYARNLVEGFGLNWARWGDPVEGFTSPLWTFLMIPVNATPIPLHLRSLVVQLLALLVLIANLFAVRRLVLAHFSSETARSWLPAVVLTAAYYPLNHWSLMGMETALQALLITTSVSLTLGVAHARSERYTALFGVLALAVLTRMDMALLAAACFVYLAPTLRRAPPSRWLPGAAVFALTVGGYQAFRMAYFGDPLPNTYYLKMTGTPAQVRIAHGLVNFLEFGRPILVALVGIALGSLLLRRSRPQVRLLLSLIALYFVYVIYVGGDVYDFDGAAGRFIAPVMPLVFVLLNGLFNDALARTPQRWRADPRPLRYATSAVGILGVLLFNGLLDVQNRAQWMTYLVIQRPLFVERYPGLVARTQRLAELIQPDALVAVSWAGVPPYFSSFRLVDFLGYNDRRIARESAHSQLTLDSQERFDPGHMKWDIAYIVDEMKPDAIYLNGSMKEPLKRLARNYSLVEDVFWLRAGSDKLVQPVPPRTAVDGAGD